MFLYEQYGENLNPKNEILCSLDSSGPQLPQIPPSSSFSSFPCQVPQQRPWQKLKLSQQRPPFSLVGLTFCHLGGLPTLPDLPLMLIKSGVQICLRPCEASGSLCWLFLPLPVTCISRKIGIWPRTPPLFLVTYSLISSPFPQNEALLHRRLSIWDLLSCLPLATPCSSPGMECASAPSDSWGPHQWQTFRKYLATPKDLTSFCRPCWDPPEKFSK